jgi:hypothetical protein
MSAKSNEIPFKKCVNSYFCISSESSFGELSFLTLNLQKLAVPNEAVRENTEETLANTKVSASLGYNSLATSLLFDLSI